MRAEACGVRGIPRYSDHPLEGAGLGLQVLVQQRVELLLRVARYRGDTVETYGRYRGDVEGV